MVMELVTGGEPCEMLYLVLHGRLRAAFALGQQLALEQRHLRRAVRLRGAVAVVAVVEYGLEEGGLPTTEIVGVE